MAYKVTSPEKPASIFPEDDVAILVKLSPVKLTDGAKMLLKSGYRI